MTKPPNTSTKRNAQIVCKHENCLVTSSEELERRRHIKEKHGILKQCLFRDCTWTARRMRRVGNHLEHSHCDNIFAYRTRLLEIAAANTRSVVSSDILDHPCIADTNFDSEFDFNNPFQPMPRKLEHTSYPKSHHLIIDTNTSSKHYTSQTHTPSNRVALQTKYQQRPNSTTHSRIGTGAQKAQSRIFRRPRMRSHKPMAHIDNRRNITDPCTGALAMHMLQNTPSIDGTMSGMESGTKSSTSSAHHYQYKHQHQPKSQSRRQYQNRQASPSSSSMHPSSSPIHLSSSSSPMQTKSTTLTHDITMESLCALSLKYLKF